LSLCRGARKESIEQGGFMSFDFAGKAALVTGGSRGIGRAIAKRLAADGAAAVINYARNQERALEVVKEIQARGGKAFAVQADVSQPGQVRRLFQEAENAVGQLDIVVANAGVHISKPLVESTEADYEFIFGNNTKGRSAMKFSLVPLLLGGRSISAKVRQALLDNHLKDAAELLMQEYGLTCAEAGDLLGVTPCG
jgi:NAD(P)-dependent dehydrogenase (short-subunit alcohol dehydrogenase family)